MKAKFEMPEVELILFRVEAVAVNDLLSDATLEEEDNGGFGPVFG